MPERPKGAVCKIAGDAYGGSNPPPPTNEQTDRRKHRGVLRTETPDNYSVDVALLNEAGISLLTKWQKAHPGAVLFNAGGTVGKDYTRNVYSAAVYSKHGPVEIRDARAKSLRGRDTYGPFVNNNHYERRLAWAYAST
jgi:hypothetical protein